MAYPPLPRSRPFAAAASVAALALLLAACAADDDGRTLPEQAEEAATRIPIVARDLTFEAPDTLRPGWTTFEFTNTSPMIHFAIVQRLPEGIGVEDQQRDVAPVFQEGYDLMVEGDMDAAMERFGALPEWFGEMIFLGGPGLTSGGVISQATVYLEPGTYMLECYVKTDGVFHSYNPEGDEYGMVHEFTVEGLPEDTIEPVASLRITISSADGITFEGAPTPGRHTVAVEFVDQIVHENFVGHDVHLARLGPDADLGSLSAWMDWSREGGLEDPAPAEFIGGTNEMPGGTTAYFTVELTPGDYAWVSEVPNALDKGMLVPFSVPVTGEGG